MHPVAWMGRAIGLGRRWLCRGGPVGLFVAGGVLTLVVLTAAGLAGWLVTSLGSAPGPAGLLLEALALKSTLALRGLAAAGREVAGALERGDLAAARTSVGRHLVSRPTATLRAEQVAAGVVESLAENLTDALVSPLMFYLLLGLPGALAYWRSTRPTRCSAITRARSSTSASSRPVSTTSPISSRRGWPGLRSVVVSGRARAAWSTMLRDHRRTAEPQRRWTMAATAGALGVTLAKPGAYSLGHGREPDSRRHRARASSAVTGQRPRSGDRL